MARTRYILTTRAESDLREARSWSNARWGRALTRRYFRDLHDAAAQLAERQELPGAHGDLDGGTGLHIHPVREHYLVYEPLTGRRILVVAVIRQGRDIPAILQKWRGAIRRELADVRSRIARGEIASVTRPSGTPRRRK